MPRDSKALGVGGAMVNTSRQAGDAIGTALMTEVPTALAAAAGRT